MRLLGDPKGSNTKAGQTNYDDLYADVLKWQKKKWIDYVIPQIYWHHGFKLADFEVLANWWNNNHYGVHIYIGHGLYRVNADSQTDAWKNPNEIPRQVELSRALPNIHGSCFFSSKSIINNPLGVADELKDNYYTQPALIPEMGWLGNTALDMPQLTEVRNNISGIDLKWEGNKGDRFYILYRFKGKKGRNFDDPNNILAILSKSRMFYQDIKVKRFRRYTYAISSVDRLYNESAIREPKTLRKKKSK